MISWLKRNWRELKEGRPGSRFQEQAEKNQSRRSQQSWVARFLEPIIAIILIAGGILLCFIPGPGLPLIFVGAALLARRSLKVARSMDWLEVKLRRVIGWGKARWRRIPREGKIAVIVLGGIGLAGAAYGAYHIAFGQ